MYFNVGRIVYLQTDTVFPYILLAPTIVAGRITLGAMNQILNAFSQVRTSFQYLINSWATMVELISIYQRLRAFEARISGEPPPAIELAAEPVHAADIAAVEMDGNRWPDRQRIRDGVDVSQVW